MAVECIVRAVHRGGMHFTGVVGNHTFEMDYPLDPGVAGEGPKPMEMLLASLAACAGGFRRGPAPARRAPVRRADGHRARPAPLGAPDGVHGDRPRVRVPRQHRLRRGRPGGQPGRDAGVSGVDDVEVVDAHQDVGPDWRGRPDRACSRRLRSRSRRRRAAARSPTSWARSASSSRSSPSSSAWCRSSAGWDGCSSSAGSLQRGRTR